MCKGIQCDQNFKDCIVVWQSFCIQPILFCKWSNLIEFSLTIDSLSLSLFTRHWTTQNDRWPLTHLSSIPLQFLQFAPMHSKTRWIKVKTCWFGSTKWFWLSISAQFAEAGKRHKQKGTSALDRLNSLIGTSWCDISSLPPFLQSPF